MIGHRGRGHAVAKMVIKDLYEEKIVPETGKISRNYSCRDLRILEKCIPLRILKLLKDGCAQHI
jgi:hypothetical protein